MQLLSLFCPSSLIYWASQEAQQVLTGMRAASKQAPVGHDGKTLSGLFTMCCFSQEPISICEFNRAAVFSDYFYVQMTLNDVQEVFATRGRHRIAIHSAYEA